MMAIIAILLFLILVTLIWGRHVAAGLIGLGILGFLGFVVLAIVALIGLLGWNYFQDNPDARKYLGGAGAVTIFLYGIFNDIKNKRYPFKRKAKPSVLSQTKQ